MQLLLASNVIAKRVFSTLYIYIDIAFLVLFCIALICKKKYLTLLWALFGGVLYMLVDYGIFHALMHSRFIEGGNLFWVLLWMSMSYGITNFALLWLWIGKDKHAIEFTLAIFIWWLVAPMIASSFGANMGQITIWRETSGYHGYMAIILAVTFGAAIVYNLIQKDRSKRFPILRLLLIGIAVQFAWEFFLLIGGIRSDGFSFEQKITTIIVNSLLETNLGGVMIFCLFVLITKFFNENLTKRKDKISFTERIKEINETPSCFKLERHKNSNNNNSSPTDV